MKEYNHHDIMDFVNITEEKALYVRFIELMAKEAEEKYNA
ncbi:GTP 3',8-cyclase MoaA, partial [Clostridium perfringens]|nr:GTP 3',8-cyclase MoaA [Clostridium perfringens]